MASDGCSGDDDLIDLTYLMRDVLSDDSSETHAQCDSSGISDRPYACFCGKSYRRPDSLKKHEVTHLNNDGKRCTFKNCDRVFLYNSDLIRHEKIHYKKAGIRVFQCDYHKRPLSFKTHRELLEHSVTHKKKLPFVCNHAGCGKRFSHKGFLESHIKSHALDRPHYPCSHGGCDKVFLTQHGLIDHEKTHSSETKRYNCSVSGCGKGFAFKSHLVRHEKTHTSLSKRSEHKCFFKGCNKTFTRPDSLKAHMERHTESNRQFHCNVEGCVRSFHTRYDLNRHIRVKHPKP